MKIDRFRLITILLSYKVFKNIILFRFSFRCNNSLIARYFQDTHAFLTFFSCFALFLDLMIFLLLLDEVYCEWGVYRGLCLGPQGGEHIKAPTTLLWNPSFYEAIWLIEGAVCVQIWRPLLNFHIYLPGPLQRPSGRYLWGPGRSSSVYSVHRRST